MLGRLTEANCGSFYNETFSWLPEGNHNSGGSPSGLVTNFSFTNNRINGASYDADGDLLADPLLGGTTNQFDAEGRAVTLEGIGAVYDALGREVEAGNEEVLYGSNGARLGLMSGAALDDMEIPLPGGDTAAYTASGVSYYRRGFTGMRQWTDTTHTGGQYNPEQVRWWTPEPAYRPAGEAAATSSTGAAAAVLRRGKRPWNSDRKPVVK